MSGNYAAVPVDTQEEKENFSNVENMDIVPENSFSPESELESGSSSHNTPLKPVDSSSHTPGLLVTGPLSIGIALNYIRKRPLHVLLLLIVITLCDLLFFYFRFTTPSLHSVEVFLDPAHADAKVSVSGSAKLSSATVSVDLKQVSCSYLYRADVSHSFSSVGDIIMDVSTGNNGAVGDGINADISLHNTKYSTLRKVVHDFSTRAEVTGQLELNCNIAFGVTWYSMISIPTHFPISQTLDIQSMKSRRVSNKDDESSSLQPRVAIEPQSDSSMHALHFLLDLKLHSMRKKLGVDSFVVHVPKLVYASTLVDRGTFKKSFLRVRTKALTLDLAQQHPMAQVDVKLSCTPAVSGPEQLLQQNVSGSGSCTLLSPVDFGLFNTELQQNKFVNISAYSLADNFISSFLGEYHFIQSVDDSLYPGNVMSDDDSAISSTSRALTVGTPSTLSSSNSVSSGASCVTVNSDGVYITQTCMVVEAGFFKIYLGMYSTEGGFTGHARSVTSWSPNGHMIDSRIEGAFSSGVTRNDIFGKMSFSVPAQNLSFVLVANKTNARESNSELLFVENLLAFWDFSDMHVKGDVRVRSLTTIAGLPHPILFVSNFNYSNHAYLLGVMMSASESDVKTDQLLHLFATGNYGGDWNRWYCTLSKSFVRVDKQDVGSMQALIGYDVPNVSGRLFTRFLVADDQTNRTVFWSNMTSLSWESEEGWTHDGKIGVFSDFVALYGVQSVANWNTVGEFQYGNNSFQLTLLENPLPSSSFVTYRDSKLDYIELFSSDGFWEYWSQSFTSQPVRNAVEKSHHEVIAALGSAFERAHAEVKIDHRRLDSNVAHNTLSLPFQFLLTGFGSYGGDWEHWQVKLNGSTMVVEDLVDGFAVGDLSYEALSNAEVDGASGRTVLNAATFLPDEVLVMETTDIVSWHSASEDWLDSGELYFISSGKTIQEAVNWNTTGSLHYGNQQFFVTLNESDWNSPKSKLSADGRGTYHAESSMDWRVDLDFSRVLIDENLVGFANGAFGFYLSALWDAADMTMQLKVLNVTNVPQIAVEQSLSWTSPVAQDWSEAGQVHVASNMYVDPSLIPDDDDGYYYTSYYYYYDAILQQYVYTYYYYYFHEDDDDDMIPPTNFNASMLFQYANHQFLLRVVERDYQFVPSSYAPDTNELLMEAIGGYGGNWEQWHAELTKSTMVVKYSVLGHIRGVVSYSSMNSVDHVNGRALFHFEVVDHNYTFVMNNTEALVWSTKSNWLDSGSVYADGMLRIGETAGFFMNGSVSLIYEDNSFVGNFYESLCPTTSFCSDNLSDHWSVLSQGTYMGTTSDWTVALTRLALSHNSELVGYFVGTAHGKSPSDNWDLEGILNYQTETRNSLDEVVVIADGGFAYYPKYKVDGGFGSSGQVIMTSMVDMPQNSANWNISGEVWYGRHQYSLSVKEQDYYSPRHTSMANNLVFFTEGGYGANFSKSQVWVSVTNSLFEVGNVTVASVVAYFSTDLSSPTEGEWVLKFAWYTDPLSGSIGPLYPAQVYPSLNEYTIFWMDNELSWKGDADLGYGFLLMNISIVENPIFSVRSEFNASFVETNAYFTLEQTMNNIDGVDMWARADYDMESGMMANMGGEFYYENKLYFGANTAYDLQVRTLDVTPTKLPTVMPSYHPSVSPSLLPGQTNSPTFQHTVTPSVSPTRSPSAVPTITARPTFSPTVVPTRQPTRSPTAIPSASPTSAVATEMGVSQTITGLNATLFNSNRNYTTALKATIAACMDNVSPDDIYDLVVVDDTTISAAAIHSLRSVPFGSQSLPGLRARINYKVLVRNPVASLSFASLSEQLSSRVEAGVFDSYLNTYAVQYNAPGLADCSSTAATVVDLVENDDSGKQAGLSLVVVVGIAVGISVGVLLLISIIVFACISSKKKTKINPIYPEKIVV